MRNILLSIIIPVYNSEKYLEECIDSLIAYKKNNIEIILVNDGSTDSSAKICDNYANKDKRIKVIHQKNSGVSIARNNGIEMAIGEYIIFVDSDDKLDQNWQRILTSKMNKDIYYIINDIEKNASLTEMLNYIIGFNDKRICFAGPFSKIFKTEFLRKNKIEFKDKLINGEDMLFNVDALLKCNSFEIINDSYYQYRNLTGSATKRFDEKIIQSDKIFHQELYNLLKISDIEKNLANNICLYSIQMAVIVILKRIAYISKYKEGKKYYNFLKHEPYTTAIHEGLKISKKFNIVFFLIKHKWYYCIYRILRILNLFDGKKRGKNCFIKI